MEERIAKLEKEIKYLRELIELTYNKVFADEMKNAEQDFKIEE